MGKVGDAVSTNNNIQQVNNNVQTTEKTGNTEVKTSTTIPVENTNGAEKVNDLKTFGIRIKDKITGLFGGETPPTEVFNKEATVTRTGGQVIIDAGKGDDQIGVSQDAKGNVTVTVNGESQTFSGADRNNLVIRAGEGNDNIWVDENVTVNLRLAGGDGDDFIRGGGGHDKLEGGAGNDRLHGNGGNDYINGSVGDDIIYGDTGNDTVYGGDGADTLYGNDGNDYLEGSKGNDTVYGNDGNDTISGGIGDDNLNGNYGDDVLYAGQGTDTLNGDDGNNRIFSQKGDVNQQNTGGINNTVVTVELKGNPGGTGVIVTGSDEFRERVEADLEMLRSSPTGRQMLTSFDEAQQNDGVTVTIQELPNENNGYADWENRLKPTQPQPNLNPTTGAIGTPNSATISYNPQFAPTFEFTDGTEAYTPPVNVLFHEMGHAYDYTHGTFRAEIYNGNDTNDSGRNLRVGERVAAGLPIDHDNDPKTAERTDDANHPDELTENALREEMNLQIRTSYIIARMTKV